MNIKLFIYFYIIIMNCILYSMEDSRVNNTENNTEDSMIIHHNFDKAMWNSAIVFFNYIDDKLYERENKNSDQNFNIDQIDSCGDTALHRAIDSNNIVEIKELLKKGASFEIPNAFESSALDLIAIKKNNEDIKQCFEEHGVFLIQHADLCKMPLFSLLKEGGTQFNSLLLNSFGSDEITMIKTVDKIFKLAHKNEYNKEFSKKYGRIINYEEEGCDCVVQMKISDFYETFGKPIIEYTEKIIEAYPKANDFIEKCNKELYDEAKALLFMYPCLYKEKCFNKYIMNKLLLNKTEKCWEFLLTSKFDPHISINLLGGIAIVLGAAYFYNPSALYFLIYFGANYKATNPRGKNCVELLIDNTKSQYKESAIQCLQAIQKALKDRIDLLKEELEYAESETAITSLLYTEDFIRSALFNENKNKTINAFY